MRQTPRRVAVCALLLPIGATGVAAQAPPSADVGAAVASLASSVERLTALLERQATQRSEERQARQVEVAVAVLGLRLRKIDSLEAELRGAEREEEETRDQVSFMKAEMERLGERLQADSEPLDDNARHEKAETEKAIRRLELQAARLAESRLTLQGELIVEQRRSANVEKILETWLEGIRR